MDDPQRPLEILGHREEWEDLFEMERSRLADAIGDRVVAIEHFGSTSVPGLAAKPIIDILPIPPTMDVAHDCKPAMLDLGYQFNAERENWLAFERYDDELDQQFNVHFHTKGSTRLERVLILRDYLREHEHARKAYEYVKRHAAAEHPYEHSAYNDAKDDIAECLITAAREAGYEPAVSSDSSAAGT